jgi:hypothetical protein
MVLVLVWDVRGYDLIWDYILFRTRLVVFFSILNIYGSHLIVLITK